uniref:non-specific serine/threonine protein kinase n=1 Tax=Kalanchoe fedtschenkoi TaxID=63787 RepID=A0A7N0U979_KALFE
MDLNLGQNVLSGPIPAAIGQLSNMQYLSLGINNFSGPVPPEIGNLTKLISLSFGSNNLEGPLPKELGNLTSLQQLYIDSSGVSGPIPDAFAKLKALQILWASDNLFTGKIPELFGTLTELIELRLEGTSLEGPIPSNFTALTKLEGLRIGDLSGQDSSLEFLRTQTRLSTLSLRNCRLSGQIPDLSLFSRLQYLDLSFNKLTGQVPSSLQDLASLSYIYLGNNGLSGTLPPNITKHQLVALDASFNPSLSGDLPLNYAKAGLSLNFAGTSIDSNGLHDPKVFEMLRCLDGNSKCSIKNPSTSFSVKCGGAEQASASGVKFSDDSETLGPASLHTSSDDKWAVSNAGVFLSNPNGPVYVAKTSSQITATLESELYKTARISPNSLRYYGLGLKNGKYLVDLHFAEITMSDTALSWKGLGKRSFDVYIQGEQVLRDFNIRTQAGGSNRALVESFEANVTNTVMEIHFLWAGKGTCCIPLQSTFGPLVSAIHASLVSTSTGASSSSSNNIGKIAGIAIGCAGAVVVAFSVLYLWWSKDSPRHMPVNTDSPKKGLVT